MCKYCSCVGVENYHSLRYVWVNCGKLLHVNRDTIGQIIKVLHACIVSLCILFY